MNESGIVLEVERTAESQLIASSRSMLELGSLAEMERRLDVHLAGSYCPMIELGMPSLGSRGSIGMLVKEGFAVLVTEFFLSDCSVVSEDPAE